MHYRIFQTFRVGPYFHATHQGGSSCEPCGSKPLAAVYLGHNDLKVERWKVEGFRSLNSLGPSDFLRLAFPFTNQIFQKIRWRYNIYKKSQTNANAPKASNTSCQGSGSGR